MLAALGVGLVSTVRAEEGLTDTEKQLVFRLHHINGVEVQLGGLAKTRASDKAVREYAAMLVRDHQRADAELRNLAKKKQLNMLEPTPYDTNDAQAMQNESNTIAHLRALKGADFDREFALALASAHDKAVGLVESAESKLHDADLRAQIDKLVPTLKHHAARAHALADARPKNQPAAPP